MATFSLHMPRVPFLATLLAGVLAGSAMAKAPDASYVLPSEPEGIPAALDAAITGPAGKDPACVTTLLIPEARMMFLSSAGGGAPGYELETLDDWTARFKARGHAMLEEKRLTFRNERYDNIAHLWSCNALQSDGTRVARGINGIQAVKEPGGWRLTGINSALPAARVVLSDREEFHMKKMTQGAQSQPAGWQAAFAKDAGTLSDKFTGLARVMSGKYDWKPAQGVRSVADVFNLIVKENGLLAGVLSGTQNTGASPAPITDPEKMQEALKASYLNLQHAIAALSDNDLHTPVKLFGRDMTKQDALMLILLDQHEHLGQSIAYARSNGVVPPWSK